MGEGKFARLRLHMHVSWSNLK